QLSIYSLSLHDALPIYWNLAWENEWAPRWVSRIEYIQKNGRDQTRLAALPTPAGFDIVYNNSGISDYRAVELTLDRPIQREFHRSEEHTSELQSRENLV